MRTRDELDEAISDCQNMLNERLKFLPETDRQSIQEVFDLIITEWTAAALQAAIATMPKPN